MALLVAITGTVALILSHVRAVECAAPSLALVRF